MSLSRAVVRGTRLLGVLLMAVFAPAAALAQDYGDTPYVQTPQNVVDKMLEIAKVGPGDYVIDLGSGDGRMVITAAKKYGARGFGVDLDKRLVALSNKNAAKAGVADRVRFYARDLYETDVSPATVLTIYLLPEVNLMVRPRLLAMLKPGTRMVSHDYDFGEWQPDLSLVMDAPGKTVGRDQKSRVFYWVVPGNAAGKWRWQLAIDGKVQDFELDLHQKFQKISGTLSAGERRVDIEDASLVGEQISFAATFDGGAAPQRYAFSGRIVNHAIAGEARISRGQAAAQANWSAARTELRAPAHVGLPPPALPELR